MFTGSREIYRPRGEFSFDADTPNLKETSQLYARAYTSSSSSFLSLLFRPATFFPSFFFSFLPHGRRREKGRKRNGVEKCYTEDLSPVTATRRKNSFARLPRVLVISVKRGRGGGRGIIESLSTRRKYASRGSVIEDERSNERAPSPPLNPRSNRCSDRR